MTIKQNYKITYIEKFHFRQKENNFNSQLIAIISCGISKPNE